MDATVTELIGKLFGSGWPVAAMLLVFIVIDRKRIVPGWALADKDKIIASLDAANAKLQAEHQVTIAFWIKRADEGAAQLQVNVKALERAVDAFEAAVTLVRRVTP